MRASLAGLLEEAVDMMYQWEEQDRLGNTTDQQRNDRYFQWVDRFPAQIAVLATQVQWSESVEASLTKGVEKGQEHPLQGPLKRILLSLTILADRILLPGIQTDRRC